MPSDPLLDDLNAVTEHELRPRIIRDVFFKGTPLLAYYRDHSLVPFGGGTFSQSIFRYAPHSGGAYGKGAAFDTSRRNTLGVARFAPKFYEVNITQYMEDIRVINKGDARIVSLVDQEMDGAMRTLNTIGAVAIINHGQGLTANKVDDDRSLEINGLLEALADGTTPTLTGDRFDYYGEALRNGAIGNVRNSVPRWCGDQSGNAGQITYDVMLQSYKDCVYDGNEPDLIASNISANSFMMQRLQARQFFTQERDPIWGVHGFRLLNAMCLEDRYFWSDANEYGENNSDLGNWQTGTITTTSITPATKSKMPANVTTLEVGEVIGIFNTRDHALRITDDEMYAFGFTGFKPRFDGTEVAGQMLAEMNVEVEDCRTSKFLFGINS
jgi:hypothetical protein